VGTGGQGSRRRICSRLLTTHDCHLTVIRQRSLRSGISRPPQAYQCTVGIEGGHGQSNALWDKGVRVVRSCR
jgi:hypothetical protein